MNNLVKKYYDDLAKHYDENRFNNSYGKYIDKQERKFLKESILKNKYKKILDLGCGTGRLLDFASFGADISSEMLTKAREKFPSKELQLGSVTAIPYKEESLDVIYSFHVIMHLDKQITKDFLKESHSKLKDKGILIFDFPSKTRRLLVNYQPNSWHGANHFTIKEIKELIESNWEIKRTRGFLFFPIHRIHKKIRFLFTALDILLCKSPFKKYASYIVIELEKK
ncbi:Methyltransferase type 11 [Flavobacterium sp. 9AF]|uniref:class I SAM-dependent DNA methyltransferase n=1 Tax=Flavobacterium sp. 9AF TaxID=2653142 RepID=UPI0012F15AF6|nr:class I SAM-dependent methyltransferase [Flavobacterium sp. 9AF]VXA94121.1 Methyltransferase type 11 [Flavobacterium sp. 9AF]